MRRKLAAVAGSVGAVTVGINEIQAVTYTPTAGVVAAQGIPGFSFVSDTNVTLGSLRPPASSGIVTDWDVDNSGGSNFRLRNNSTWASLLGQAGLGSLRGGNGQLSGLGAGFTVSQSMTWNAGFFQITSSQANIQTGFPTGSGQFGFRFTNAANTYYGWGSLVIDAAPAGQGFMITEAYYRSTPGAAIKVGEVPVAVPEPTGMALLGLGAAGVAAWRARRKERPQA